MRLRAASVSGWSELEIGYWLVKEHQGKGYALEARLRCIDYAREVMNASSLLRYIAPRNVPSIRLPKRLGAAYEDTIELASHGPHWVFRVFGSSRFSAFTWRSAKQAPANVALGSDSSHWRASTARQPQIGP
jgi:RimJ/RimL family protein N-acetyltransferase